MEDKYEELGCEFKNEAECEEELEENGISVEVAEKVHYEEEE